MPFHVSSPHSIQLYVTLFKLWYKKKCKNLFFFFIRDNYYLSLDSLDMFVIYQLLVKSDMSVLGGIRVKVPQVEESTVKDTPSSSYGGLVCTVRWFTKCKPERKSRSAWWCQAFSPAHIRTLLENLSKNVTQRLFSSNFGLKFEIDKCLKKKFKNGNHRNSSTIYHCYLSSNCQCKKRN